MSRKKSIGLIFVVVVAFWTGVFSFWFYQKKGVATLYQSNEEEIELNTADVLAQDAVLSKKYVGYVTPVHEAVIQPFISGFIEEINVKGGQNVKKGEILLILKQDEYQAKIKAAKAALEQAKANLKNKEVYYRRLQKAGKAVSPSELDAAEADYLASLASLQSAEADLKIAEVNYEYTYIKSGISGVTGDVSLTKGNYVSPQSKLLTVMQFEPIRVVFSVPSSEYRKEMKKTKPFEDEKIFLAFENGDIFHEEGAFQYTDNAINQATDSMAVYVDFKNKEHLLIPNSYVTVLCFEKLKNVVLVPKQYVVMKDSGNFIYVVRGGTLKQVEIKILGTIGENFAAQNVFENQDQIVLQNVNPADLDKKVKQKKEA